MLLVELVEPMVPIILDEEVTSIFIKNGITHWMQRSPLYLLIYSDIDTQFMLGPAIMVSPILEQGAIRRSVSHFIFSYLKEVNEKPNHLGKL